MVSPTTSPTWSPQTPGAAPSASTPASFAPRPTVSPVHTQSLEERIGGNWLLWVGIVAIVLGTVYFLKLAFDNQWIGPHGRIAIGFAFGMGFIYWGELLQSRKYPIYGQTVTGGGIAILYLSIYAALNFYHLIQPAAAFALMILITATGSMLAARYASLALAFIGLIGGFLTPYWLSTGEDHQITLLTYIAILVAGVAFLAHRQRWMILNYCSFVLTLLLFLGWASSFYTRDKRGTTEFFLCVFAALFFYIGREAFQRVEAGSRVSVQTLMGVTAFLFFNFSSINLFKSGVELFSFMLVFDALLLLLALRTAIRWTGLAALLLNSACIFVWLKVEYNPDQLPSALAFVTAMFLLFLAWPILFILREKLAARRTDLVLTTANGLGYFWAAYFLLNDRYHGVLGLYALVMGAIYLALANFIWKRAEAEKRLALVTLGLAITFVTLAIPIQLKQNWITLSWSVEAVVLTWIGIRASSRRMRQAAGVVLGLVVFRLLVFDQAVARESFQPVINKRFFTYLMAILACYAIAWLTKNLSTSTPKTPKVITALMLLASGLTVILLTLEAREYYSIQHWIYSEKMMSEGRSIYGPGSSVRSIENAKQLSISVLWAIYSIALIVVGILKRYRTIRLFAMGLFGLTIVKVFFVDLASLEAGYKVLSFIVLGAILLLAAYLYQRFRTVLFGS